MEARHRLFLEQRQRFPTKRFVTQPKIGFEFRLVTES
jgi:hypothetical protein